jgi:D-glycero-alpha-D-manno-heptose 1-phosphate guanylyltransferase
MKAVLLVGGLGTRLRSAVPSLPKALAQIGDRPFLELLVKQLSSQGIRELVMCTGYLSEHIKATFGDGSILGVRIEYSEETAPLGTAGALRLARHCMQDEHEFLVLNGDSFLEIDFNSLLSFHRKHCSLATMAAVPVQNSSRYGTVQVGADGRVLGFAEKTGENAPGIVNAGVYVFGNSVLTKIPTGQASLELDIFPKLLDGGMYAFVQQNLFIDIGTPEDYRRAREMCDRLVYATLSR